jgi:hypothetical protein
MNGRLSAEHHCGLERGICIVAGHYPDRRSSPRSIGRGFLFSDFRNIWLLSHIDVNSIIRVIGNG